MQPEALLSSLENIPKAAILLFVVLGGVLAAEIWYLRPKRKLPQIPKTEETPIAQPPSPRLVGLRPLSQRQVLVVAFLLILLVIIPVGVFLLKQTWEAKKRIVALPSPPPTIVSLPTPIVSPSPTPPFSPTPTLLASASAVPGKLVTVLPTLKPTISPTPTPSPKKSPPPGRGALETPSPSPELPSVEKPKELPGAAVSEQVILLSFLTLLAFSLGIVTFRRGKEGQCWK